MVALEPDALLSQDEDAFIFAQHLVTKYALPISVAAKIAADQYEVKKQPLYEKLHQI